MKAEQLHESVRPATVIVIGLTLAFSFGSAMGKGQFKWVIIFFVALIAVGLLLTVRQRIWLILPAAWMLSGKVNVLPLPFTVTHLGIMLAFGTCLVLKALKMFRLKPKFDTLDLWMVIMLLYVGTAFIRHPTGVDALGSDRVGGKPYVDTLVACLAYWVLARSVATPRQSFLFPILVIASNGVLAFLNLVADRIPALAGPLSEVYSGIIAGDVGDSSPTPLAEGGRFAYLEGVGTSMAQAACSFWRPLTTINPLFIWRFLLCFLGLMAILLSGFRSGIFATALFFIVSSYYRRGMVEVARVCAMGAAALGILLVLQGSVLQLPYPAQRALSFLPGKWDPMAKIDAEESTAWRVDMWQAMLYGDKYIENKWVGDGFGFTKRQLDIMQANNENGTTADQKENLLIGGGVHSGPVSSIRFVGYIGLFLFLVLLVMTAIKAHRLILRARGTPYLPVALFIGVPIVIFPLIFVAIFGAFENDLPYAIFKIGLLKMLENSLAAFAATSTAAAPAREVVQPPKARVPRQFAPAG
jgi:hypothetical protein